MEHDVAVNRKAVGLHLLVRILVFGAGAWFYTIVVGDQSDPLWTRLLFVILTLPAVAIAAYGLVHMATLLFRHRGLVLTDRGLTDYTTDLGFVPWSNIAGLQRVRSWGLQTVTLDVADLDRFLADRRLISRMLWRYAAGRLNVRPRINAAFLQDSETIYDLLRDRMQTV